MVQVCTKKVYNVYPKNLWCKLNNVLMFLRINWCIQTCLFSPSKHAAQLHVAVRAKIYRPSFVPLRPGWGGSGKLKLGWDVCTKHNYGQFSTINPIYYTKTYEAANLMAFNLGSHQCFEKSWVSNVVLVYNSQRNLLSAVLNVRVSFLWLKEVYICLYSQLKLHVLVFYINESTLNRNWYHLFLNCNRIVILRHTNLTKHVINTSFRVIATLRKIRLH